MMLLGCHRADCRAPNCSQYVSRQEDMLRHVLRLLREQLPLDLRLMGVRMTQLRKADPASRIGPLDRLLQKHRGVTTSKQEHWQEAVQQQQQQHLQECRYEQQQRPPLHEQEVELQPQTEQLQQQQQQADGHHNCCQDQPKQVAARFMSPPASPAADRSCCPLLAAASAAPAQTFPDAQLLSRPITAPPPLAPEEPPCWPSTTHHGQFLRPSPFRDVPCSRNASGQGWAPPPHVPCASVDAPAPSSPVLASALPALAAANASAQSIASNTAGNPRHHQRKEHQPKDVHG